MRSNRALAAIRHQGQQDQGAEQGDIGAAAADEEQGQEAAVNRNVVGNDTAPEMGRLMRLRPKRSGPAR